MRLSQVWRYLTRPLPMMYIKIHTTHIVCTVTCKPFNLCNRCYICSVKGQQSLLLFLLDAPHANCLLSWKITCAHWILIHVCFITTLNGVLICRCPSCCWPNIWPVDHLPELETGMILTDSDCPGIEELPSTGSWLFVDSRLKLSSYL